LELGVNKTKHYGMHLWILTLLTRNFKLVILLLNNILR
jgi:hypothetical protein